MKKIKIAAFLCAVFMIVPVFGACQKETSESVKGYTILEENFGDELYGIGFRKNDIAFGLEVQKYLDAMMEDGKAAEISQKWFGKDTLLKNAKFEKESEAPQGDDSLEKIKAKGFFTLGLDDGFPPMGFLDSDGEIKGYDIDLAKEVAKRMGVELKIQPINWDSKELELTTGTIDCIWNGMTITDARKEEMYFAKAYIKNKQIIIVAENSDIKTKEDLKDKDIGVQKGSSAVSAIQADELGKDLELKEYENNIDVFNDLKAGRVDAMVVDEVVGRYIIEKD